MMPIGLGRRGAPHRSHPSGAGDGRLLLIAREMVSAVEYFGYIRRQVNGLRLEIAKGRDGAIYLHIRSRYPLSVERVDEIERLFFDPGQVEGRVFMGKDVFVVAKGGDRDAVRI